MTRIPVVFLWIVLLSGCRAGHPGQERTFREKEPGSVTGRPASSGNHAAGNRYATRFTIEELDCLHILRVFDPWQQSRGVQYTYVLGNDSCSIPDSLAAYPFIRVPVTRVIAMSTTHLAMIAQLDRESSVVGASGTGLIYSPNYREQIREGMLKEVGSPQGLNYEILVALKPDVVFFYGVEGSTVAVVEKLEEMGVRVVYCAEYLERHPLGKAEWIRFFGSFFGLGGKARAFFRETASNYLDLAGQVGDTDRRPAVMLGLPWKDSWYVAGGNSYPARLIRDAGGKYIWEDLESDEAVPFDLETVFARAVRADYWLNPGAAESLGEIVAYDRRFEVLPVLLNRHVYNNNARMSSGGGNDYWESATVRPDLVLADLIDIFHPGTLPDHSLYYYRKLK